MPVSKQKVTAQKTPTKPVTQVRGTGTTADPSNCYGSGKPWATGGKCQECGATASVLQDLYAVTARRNDGELTPRVPKHPQGTTDARTSRDASVLNGVTAPPKPARPSRSPKTTPGQAVPSSSAGQRPAGPAKPAPAKNVVPAKDRTKTEATPKQARKTKDPVTAEFTNTIQAYLPWFKDQLTAAGLNWDKLPRERLAGLAITMYSRFQVSPERRAARNGS